MPLYITHPILFHLYMTSRNRELLLDGLVMGVARLFGVPL